jgi:hypothetical protein
MLGKTLCLSEATSVILGIGSIRLERGTGPYRSRATRQACVWETTSTSVLANEKRRGAAFF